MAWKPPPTRSACFEKRFDEERAALSPNYDRFDDAFWYIEHELCIDATIGTQTQTPDVWVVRQRVPTPNGVVRASIFYKFDDNEVTFLSIK